MSEGARQHLVTAFWEYIILLEVAYKLLEKDQNVYRYNHDLRDLYVELEETYRAKEFSAAGDFSERLLSLSEKIVEKYSAAHGTASGQKLTAQDVTQLLYTHDIKELRSRVSTYLARKDAVWILFDNLDKAWSTQGIDSRPCPN